MAETTPEDKAQTGADIAAAVRDRGMEKMEGAKGQLADGAERVAAAVERTAGELEADGDNAISGFGHSVASVMRQLAGGLRERDIEEFARELAALARRNPGVFLAGSVALGFGIARFFKAGMPPSSETRRSWDGGWQSSQRSTRGRGEYDPEEYDASEYDASEYDAEEYEERLDLSSSSTERSDAPQSDKSRNSAPQVGSAPRDAEQERDASRSRQAGKQKAKPQRASTAGTQPASPSSDMPSVNTSATAATTDSEDSALTGGSGGGAPRGGKS